MVKWLCFYMITINIIGFYLMYIDKEKSKRGQYRISEATLWKVAIMGGAVGSTIGMKMFRHKTKHTSFKLGFPTIALIQVVLFIKYLLSVFFNDIKNMSSFF